jgi:hypothetical protein
MAKPAATMIDSERLRSNTEFFARFFAAPSFLLVWLGLGLTANALAFGFVFLILGSVGLVFMSYVARHIDKLYRPDGVGLIYVVGAFLMPTAAASVLIGIFRLDDWGLLFHLGGLGLMIVSMLLVLPSAHRNGGATHIFVGGVALPVPTVYLLLYFRIDFYTLKIDFDTMILLGLVPFFILLIIWAVTIRSVAKKQVRLNLERQISEAKAHDAEMRRIKKSMTPAEWELFKVQLENKRLLEQIKNKPSGAIGPRPTYGITNDIWD